MLLCRRRWLSRGAVLAFWLAATSFIYLWNMAYLMENAGTRRGESASLDLANTERSRRVYTTQDPYSMHKPTNFKRPDRFLGDVFRSTYKNIVQDRTEFLHEGVNREISRDMFPRAKEQIEIQKYIFRDLLRRPRVSKNGNPARHRRNVTTTEKRERQDHEITRASVNQRQKLILFYNPCNFQIVRNLTNMTYTFENCKVRNCRMSFNQSEATVSDAVIFHWFKQLKSYPNFTRPRNQAWIFIQHEPTRSYARNSTQWPFYYPGLKNNFNWTMTYSRFSDIHLPYGMMKLKPITRTAKDYLQIAKSKTKDAIWVVSKCPTSGRREEYVNILKKYIDVEILGACGRNWSCGVRSNHPLDNCFSILNKTYRYYLAFENDLCDDYVSEKFYENYEYDLLQVVRAGHPFRRPVEFIDKDAYIDTKDFKNAHKLGKYLQNLSNNVTRYAQMLATKDKYEVITYQELFQKSLCNICERLNNFGKYKYVYKDVSEWMHMREPCYRVTDLD